jgi:hypothetical protein
MSEGTLSGRQNGYDDTWKPETLKDAVMELILSNTYTHIKPLPFSSCSPYAIPHSISIYIHDPKDIIQNAKNTDMSWAGPTPAFEDYLLACIMTEQSPNDLGFDIMHWDDGPKSGHDIFATELAVRKSHAFYAPPHHA